MEQPSASELNGALDRAVVQSRRLKLTTLLLAVLLGWLVMLRPGISAPVNQYSVRARSVEAQRFVLRDEQGNLRGQLELEDNKPVFELYDQSGNVVWTTELSFREMH